MADIVGSTCDWNWKTTARPAVLFICLANGMQNAATNGPKRDVKVMTSFVTGNLHKVSQTLTDMIYGLPVTEAAKRDCLVAASTIIAVALGAIVGTLQRQYVSTHWMFTPIGVYLGLVTFWHDIIFKHMELSELSELPHTIVAATRRGSQEPKEARAGETSNDYEKNNMANPLV